MSLVAKRPKHNSDQLALGTTIRGNGIDSHNTYQLNGHEGDVLTIAFDRSGQLLASGSADKSILLWNMTDIISGKSTASVGNIKGGHKGAVLDVKWSRDGTQLFSASSDTTIGTWDALTGVRIRKHTGHSGIVNSLAVVSRGSETIISGSDDGHLCFWDLREKEAQASFKTDLPVIAVAVDTAGQQIYSAGIDNNISVWDVRQNKVVNMLIGHGDTVTGLEVSPNDEMLVSNSMDSTVRTWDIRAFSSDNLRLIKVYDGAPASTMEQAIIRSTWSPDGSRLACGSSDRTAVVWDAFSGNIVNKLPGHLGTVNTVRFSPGDTSLLASCSADRTVILGKV